MCEHRPTVGLASPAPTIAFTLPTLFLFLFPSSPPATCSSFFFVSFRFFYFPPCPSPCTVYVFFLLHVSAPLLSGPRLGPPHLLMHDLLIHSSLINIHLYTLSTHSSLPLLSILAFFPSPSLAADIGVGSAALRNIRPVFPAFPLASGGSPTRRRRVEVLAKPPGHLHILRLPCRARTPIACGYLSPAAPAQAGRFTPHCIPPPFPFPSLLRTSHRAAASTDVVSGPCSGPQIDTSEIGSTSTPPGTMQRTFYTLHVGDVSRHPLCTARFFGKFAAVGP